MLASNSSKTSITLVWLEVLSMFPNLHISWSFIVGPCMASCQPTYLNLPVYGEIAPQPTDLKASIHNSIGTVLSQPGIMLIPLQFMMNHNHYWKSEQTIKLRQIWWCACLVLAKSLTRQCIKILPDFITGLHRLDSLLMILSLVWCMNIWLTKFLYLNQSEADGSPSPPVKFKSQEC